MSTCFLKVRFYQVYSQIFHAVQQNTFWTKDHGFLSHLSYSFSFLFFNGCLLAQHHLVKFHPSLCTLLPSLLLATVLQVLESQRTEKVLKDLFSPLLYSCDLVLPRCLSQLPVLYLFNDSHVSFSRVILSTFVSTSLEA